jgi:hypothetical protein
MHGASGNSECHILALVAVGDCALADVHCCN